MGLIGSFGCVNSYSNAGPLFWRFKAAVKKAVKKNGGKKQFKFQYDPSNYALNFDETNWVQVAWLCFAWLHAMVHMVIEDIRTKDGRQLGDNNSIMKAFSSDSSPSLSERTHQFHKWGLIGLLKSSSSCYVCISKFVISRKGAILAL